MTNEGQQLREIAERWMGKKHPITMRPYVSDLTALISEHYTANEEVEKMVEEKLRNELMAYDRWLMSHDMGYDFDSTEQCVDEYLKSRESHE